jgi:ferredoxin
MFLYFAFSVYNWSMKVVVDKSLCIGCGTCVSGCPDCFEFGDDGKSQVKAGCKEGCCDLKQIVDDCPVAAITVTE